MSKPDATLKPCPFCGGDASFGKIQDDYNRDFGGEFISCDTCEVSTGLRFATMEDVKPLLAETWNRRTEAVPGFGSTKNLPIDAEPF